MDTYLSHKSKIKKQSSLIIIFMYDIVRKYKNFFVEKWVWKLASL